MNIIKLEDKIMPANSPQADFFNTYLKGKYAYWIHMRYIVPLETLGENGYVACEEDITKLLKNDNGEYPKPYGTEYLDIYSYITDLYDKTALNIMEYIDVETTDKINNINEWKLKNTYVVDSDITTDELKVFRTWLAEELLKFDIFEDKEYRILNYYANGMMDDTIISLNIFSTNNINIQSVNNGCGCCQDTTSLYTTTISSCDSIALYKKNIYKGMVQMFSTYEFWNQFSKEFIFTFKKYIENIVNIGLPLSKNQYSTTYNDCSCVASTTPTQHQNITLLNNLITALDYIYNNDINGHKNFINDALNSWAELLYEDMYWR